MKYSVMKVKYKRVSIAYCTWYKKEWDLRKCICMIFSVKEIQEK